MGLLSKKEQWHCESFKTGEKMQNCGTNPKTGKKECRMASVYDCKCVCHDSLGCAIRHHHTSGYSKTFEHCTQKIAPPTPAPKSSKGITLAGYAEGSYYHKAVTVYNDGCHAEELSGFNIAVFHNGRSATPNFVIPLRGNLKSGESVNVCNTKSSNAKYYSKKWRFGCKQYTNDLLHNGNDVIELRDGEHRVVYAIGAKGSQTYFAKDKTCMRTSKGTFPSAWDCSFAQNTVPEAKLMPAPVCVTGPKPTLKPTQFPTAEPTNTPTLAEGGTPEGCYDTRPRGSLGWRFKGRTGSFNQAEQWCNGYKYVSLECPNSKGFEVFCVNNPSGIKLHKGNCEGKPAHQGNLGSGKNHHCVGPYKWGGYWGGGWHRGALYPMKDEA
jgi:hypothetical protein